MTHIPSSMSQIMTFPHLFKHGYQRTQRKQTPPAVNEKNMEIQLQEQKEKQTLTGKGLHVVTSEHYIAL